MRPLIINLLTFLRTKNYEQEQKKTTKRVEKVDVDDDVVLEEKEYLFQPLKYLPQHPSEGGEHKPLTNLIFLPRYCYKRALEYGHKSGLLARYLSLYSRREQTLYYVHHSHKVGLPPFGRVGVGFWRTGLGIALQLQPLCRAISTILRVNLNHFTRRYAYTGSDEFKYECMLRLKLPYSLFNLMVPIVVTINRSLHQRSALC